MGFQALTDPESPKQPFEILATRYETPPENIIYDNSCKLHVYSLNREPRLFTNSKFLVDRLHYKKGHTACTAGYCMDTYRTNADIRQINSQVNEQGNAGLQRLKGQLSYQTPANFIFHVKLYLALTNESIIRNLNQ
jgi:hypothetical protein